MPDPVVTPAQPTATPGAAPVAAVVAAPAVAPPAAVVAPAAPAVAAPVATTLLTSPGDGTQGVAPKGQDPAPADIKITVPEGFTADKGMIAKFTGYAKEKNLSPEVAQGLFDQFVETQQASVRAAQTQHAEQITTWAEEARNDPEIGGAKFDATLASAKKALSRFGSPDLSKLLTDTGLGNHKAVIKALAQVGSKISEDTLPAGVAPVAGEAVDPLRAMYPSMFPK